MKEKQKLHSSLLIGEMFFPISYDDKNILEVIRRAGELGFYEGVETGIIFDSKVASKIRTECENKKLRLTQWSTLNINNENLNLSSVNKEIRNKSLSRVKELIHFSAECGTKTFALTSGPDPGAAYREEAKKYLADSLHVVCNEVKRYNKDMDVVMEHLDRYVHKKQLLGPVDETVIWMMPIHQDCPNMYLGWDAAHAALDGENLITTLHQAAPIMAELHLSNAVLNPSDPLYGDNHMKYGAPGFLTIEVAGELLKTAVSLNTLKERDGIFTAVEIRTTKADDLWKVEKESREFLKMAIELAND
ncbi:MAG TPA: TIM barrel protein [Clostridium sp.]|uniref:sugar phosphate isomerase/epimerase family protein n=1 Tax=Clostridium sp. TaxID=1506 RepID=UPI002F957D3F